MNSYRFKLFTFCLFLSFTSALSAQIAEAANVLKTEHSRFEAMMHRDTNTLKRLLAEDLVYIHSNALKETRTDHLRSISTGKIVYQSMEREEATVRIYGKIALTSGAIKVKGILSGNPFDIRMLYTAVYRKKQKVWQLINWQTTRLP